MTVWRLEDLVADHGVFHRSHQARSNAAATGPVKIWFDQGDFLEVLFDASRPGYFRETLDDRVMEKVSDDGALLGFSILGVSTMRAAPVAVDLQRPGA